MFFWNSLGFFYDPTDVGKSGTRSSGPSAFSNPACTSGSLWFMYCWSLAWRILHVTLLACEMSEVIRQFEYSLALPLFRTAMKADLFQSCGHCWVFKICWHIECSIFFSYMIFYMFQCHSPKSSHPPSLPQSPGTLPEDSTGLEKVSFHSNPKEGKCQRMFELPHNCTHLTR